MSLLFRYIWIKVTQGKTGVFTIEYALVKEIKVFAQALKMQMQDYVYMMSLWRQDCHAKIKWQAWREIPLSTAAKTMVNNLSC